MPTLQQTNIILESEFEFKHNNEPMEQTEPTIEQIKETIAQFMGYEKVRVGYFDDPSETEWQRNNEAWIDKVGIRDVGWYVVNVKEDKWVKWEDLAYDTDWNMLMEVIEKIEELEDDIVKRVYTSINGKTCSLWNFYDVKGLLREDSHLNCPFSKRHVGKTKKEAVHKAVYQFIVWLNNQNKN